MKIHVYLRVIFLLINLSILQISYSQNSREWISDVMVNDSVYLINSSNSDTPFNISISVNGDPAYSVGLAWFSNPQIKNGEVLFVEKDKPWDNATVIKGAGENKWFNYLNSRHNEIVNKTLLPINENREYICFKAKIDNLKPATQYKYKVRNERAESHTGYFKTASLDDNLNFIYLTDFQLYNLDSYNKVEVSLRNAVSSVKEPSFILITGDFVDSPDNIYAEWEWEHFFARFKDILMNNIIVPVLGNHDRNLSNNFFYHFNTDDSFNMTSSVKTETSGTNYCFPIGNSVFFILNYNDYNKRGYFDELKKWLDKKVEENEDKKWRIAAFHRNMYTGGMHQSDSDQKAIRENMSKWFDDNKIDFAIQGHDHVYEVIGPVDNINKKLLKDNIKDLTYCPEEISASNMKGTKNGIFDMSEGTIYFLNNSVGNKRYNAIPESIMKSNYNMHLVEDYWSLLTGRFGQNNKSIYSNINIESDSIRVDSYSVNSVENADHFDKFSLFKSSIQNDISQNRVSPIKIIENMVFDFYRDVDSSLKCWMCFNLCDISLISKDSRFHSR